MKYQFGNFTVDSRTRRLLRVPATTNRGGTAHPGGVEVTEVHLSPKAFDLLLLLVENRSRAVSKAELHEKLWPSTFVQETNIAGLVAEIRRALDDAAEQPRCLRTVHRFGYWFIADVRETGDLVSATKTNLKYWLIWEKRQISLNDGENLVGRAPDASVWIDAPGVSRHHARIVLHSTGATVEDLGSKNGTFVGGRRITSLEPLSDGDHIRVGSVVITFRIPPPGGATETQNLS